MKIRLQIEYFLLAFIMVGALTVRLYKINNPVADWHSWRQADTASVSKFFVRDGIDLFRPRYHDISSLQTSYENPKGWRFVEFPLFNAIHALLFSTFGRFSLEMWGRLTSVILTLISTVFIFLIGKKFLGVVGGLLSAFFFAFLPFNIYFTRVILPEPLAVAWGLGTIWFFVKWLDKEKPWDIMLATVFFAAALLTKPFVGFYVVPLLFLSMQKFGLKRIFGQFWLWVFAAVPLIPFFAWRAWMQQREFLVGIPFWGWVFNGDNIRFRPAFWYWIAGERLGNLILGVWGAFPFVAGLLRGPWFLHWFLIGAFLYMATVATANVRHDYYQTLIIPPIALVLAAGTLTVWKLKGVNQFLLRTALIASILFGIFLSFYKVREFYKINHPEIIRAGLAVQRLTPKDAKVIAPYFGDTAFLYQTDRVGWPHATLPMPEMIERLSAQYYVSVNFDKQTKEVMERYTVLEKTEEYVVVKLQ